MHAPQITLLALYLLSLGITLGQDGKPKTGKHSFGWTALSCVIVCGVLWWGGFWG